jgi:hypothetical protein
MKPIVFLVHGMGKHEDDWHLPVIAALDEAVQSHGYARFAGRNVTDLIEFVPLGYDGILREAVGRIEDSAQLLQGLAPFSDEVAALGQWFDGSSLQERKFIWSHAMDVVLYRIHTPTRQLIRTTLIDEMAPRIHEVLSTSPTLPVSVLAHSLGTAVAHDAIHFLGGHEWGGQPNAFAPNIWRFNTITMLANVCRLLRTEVDPAVSIVRPGPTGQPGSYCMKFLNIRHEFDPIPWPLMFDTSNFVRRRTRDLVIRHVHEPNVHGWIHYLLNPRVHVPFLRAALGDRDAISRSEAQTARQAFPRWGGEFAELADSVGEVKTDFPKELGSIKDLFGLDPTLKDIAAAFTAAASLYEKYAQKIEDLGGGP